MMITAAKWQWQLRCCVHNEVTARLCARWLIYRANDACCRPTHSVARCWRGTPGRVTVVLTAARHSITSQLIQLPRPTQPFILFGSTKLESDVCCRLQVYSLVKATEVTAGLAKSNGSLLPGLWRDSLHVTCGLTACTPGSAAGPTLGNEYGKTLPF